MAKSNLLLTEQPIVINKELAKIIGLNEAIVLQQIEYWININEQAKKENNFQDGFYWTYNTIEEWTNEFPFWSGDTVKRTLSKLRKRELLITNRYNIKKYDRTLWYRINYEKLNELEKNYTNKNTISAKCPNEELQGIKKEKSSQSLKTLISAKCPNGKVQNAPMEKCKMPQPIPEITTKTSTEISTSSSSNEEALFKIFEENICKLKKTTFLKFNSYVEKYNKEFILAIIEYCTEIDIKSFAGFKTVIDSYIEKKIFTKEDMLKDITEFRRKKKNKKSNYKKNKKDNFNNYEQRDYTAEEFSKFEQNLSGSADPEALKRMRERFPNLNI
ncbi:DnaD domain protein [Clostridium tetani]|uniref:DnaD domain protein n=1 Tax=Clostridium tetani TaxID=1513 RepID=UPI001026A24B|nr:DnaD domain protein [Clostridium tetani]RXI70523.1 hypothetical protein DP127_09510 [Clostridium tetani]